MDKRNKPQLRFVYLDVLKGIGIILVIAGHLIPRGVLWNLIYGVHMPLFLLCSGILEKTCFHWSRIRKLAIYYVVLATICTGIYWLLHFPGDCAYIKQTIVNILTGGPSPRHGIWPVEALWFLPSFMLITLLFHMLRRFPFVTVQYLFIIIGIVLGAILSQHRNSWTMYFSFDVCLLLFPFFFLGFSLKQKITVLANMKSSLLLLIAILSGILYPPLALANGEINIYRGIWGHSLIIYYLEALAGAIFLLSLSILIQRYVRPASALLSQFGKHTLIMMGTHQLLIFTLRPLVSSQIILLLFAVLISFSISLMISCLTTFLYKRRMTNHD